MADRLAKGNLAVILRDERAEGKSFESIGRDLYNTFGIEATSQTVANWCDGLEIPRPAKAAS